MANKLALMVTLMVAMVAVATATTYTTVVTTTSFDDEVNQGRGEQCRREVEGRRFTSCERYLSQGGQYIEMMLRNHGRQEEQMMMNCCEELRKVDEACQCQAIRQAASRAQLEQGQSWGKEEALQSYQKARELPQRCQLQTRECKMHMVLV